MVQKGDWKTVDLPEQTAQFVLEHTLSDEELEAIQEGHRPQEMEDKWFMYQEDGNLFLHRSWTGYCIYVVELSQTGKLCVTVNRDPEQYRETDLEQDRLMVEILINQLIQTNHENAELMKRYMGRKRSQ